MRRYANRRDSNEKEIVDALEAIGAVVYRLDLPVDLLVGYRSRNFLIEVKDGGKPPSRTKRTEQQRKFMSTWVGQVRVVKSVSEALDVVTKAYRSPQTGA